MRTNLVTAISSEMILETSKKTIIMKKMIKKAKIHLGPASPKSCFNSPRKKSLMNWQVMTSKKRKWVCKSKLMKMKTMRPKTTKHSKI